MGGEIIDGKAIAAAMRGEMKTELEASMAAGGVQPTLAVVLVGNRTDSATYVRMKVRACEEVGIKSIKVELEETASEDSIVEAVRKLNDDASVHGILVQLPLPAGVNETRVVDEVSLDKDVDGFHPINIGTLALRGREPLFKPCTPAGCIELLRRSGVEMSGADAVVVGRSNIVGMPVALLLQQENATVTVCHSRTADLPAVVRRADIVVAAIGRAEMIRGDWLKPGCVVIDVGMNSVDDASKKAGYRLCGDVHFKEAIEVASKITPVPGGVGPMTIAMLLQNTLKSAARIGAQQQQA